MTKKIKSSAKEKNLRTTSMWLNSLSSAEKELLQKWSYHCSCFYNVCLYQLRQAFFNKERIPNDTELYHLTKTNEHFSLLMNDCSQQIRRVAVSDMNSFLGQLKAKKSNTIKNKVNFPKYKKDKYSKENLLSNIIFNGRVASKVKSDFKDPTIQRIRINSSKNFKTLYPEMLHSIEFSIPLGIDKINEIRIIPYFKGEAFKMEIIYEVKPNLEKHPDNGRYLSIDIGLNNLLTCLNSTTGASIILDGRYLKSINQWYNKKNSKIQSKIDLLKNEKINDSMQLNRLIRKKNKLSRKRNNILLNYFHRSANYVVDYCVKHNINTIIIGENKEQKQEINIGAVNNQNFVSIPFYKLKKLIEYKAKQVGVNYCTHEESYTSKTSFIDLEPISKRTVYVGKRVNRGLFKTAEGILLNADVNGAGNILRKYLTSSGNFESWHSQHFEEASRGIVNCPRKLTLSCLQDFKAS